MLGRIHRDNAASRPAFVTILSGGGICSGMAVAGQSPLSALRCVEGIVCDNIVDIFIAKHVPASTAFIQPDRVCIPHFLKPIVRSLYILQSRKLVQHVYFPFSWYCYLIG